MLELYEEVVEDWYFHHQDQRLENFLCQNHVLTASEQGRRRPFDLTLLFKGSELNTENKWTSSSLSVAHASSRVASSSPLSECINEVWKGDMGTKGPAESESTDEEEGKTHDGGELWRGQKEGKWSRQNDLGSVAFVGRRTNVCQSFLECFMGVLMVWNEAYRLFFTCGVRFLNSLSDCYVNTLLPTSHGTYHYFNPSLLPLKAICTVFS